MRYNRGMLKLHMPLLELKRIDKVCTFDLAKVGLLTLEDLLKYAPTRHEDRTRCAKLTDLVSDQPTFIAAIGWTADEYPLKRS